MFVCMFVDMFFTNLVFFFRFHSKCAPLPFWFFPFSFFFYLTFFLRHRINQWARVNKQTQDEQDNIVYLNIVSHVRESVIGYDHETLCFQFQQNYLIKPAQLCDLDLNLVSSKASCDWMRENIEDPEVVDGLAWLLSTAIFECCDTGTLFGLPTVLIYVYLQPKNVLFADNELTRIASSYTEDFFIYSDANRNDHVLPQMHYELTLYRFKALWY